MYSTSIDHERGPHGNAVSILGSRRSFRRWMGIHVLLLLAAGCSTQSTSAVKQVGTSTIEGNLTSDTQQDLGHEHRHLHGGGQRHDHEHNNFEGAHEHPHLHGHRHAPPSHGGKVVAIGHIDHKSPDRKHYHAEVPPIADGVLRIYLSCMGSADDAPTTDAARFAPDSFAGMVRSSSEDPLVKPAEVTFPVMFHMGEATGDQCFAFFAELPIQLEPRADQHPLQLSVPEINLGGETYAFETEIPISAPHRSGS